jgi:hypothetical protein
MTKTPKFYTGWALPENERAKLLAQFVPIYPDVIAHHITDAFDVGEDHPLPEGESAEVVGIASDHRVQTLVVSINGTTARADGKVFHITWSIDREAGAKPAMSNDLIATGTVRAVDPVPISIIPSRFRM